MNKVINCDILTFMKRQPDNIFDLIIADPPYNQNIAKWDTFRDLEYWRFMQSWILEASRVLREGGTLWVFNTPYNSAKTIPILEKNKLVYQNWITWFKKDGFGAPKSKFRSKQETLLFFSKGSKPKIFNYEKVRENYSSVSRINAAKKNGILKNGKRWFPNPAGALRSDVWEFSSQRHNEKILGRTKKSMHPTPKPHKLLETIIKVSTNSESTLLDLFSGSGAASIVAKKLGIKSVAIEKNKGYAVHIRNELRK